MIVKNIRTWSPSQLKIFAFVEKESGSAIINAVAGSGKTTTIVEAVKLTPTTAYVAFVAFNKTIAEELKTRLPNRSNIRAMTLNSMGFQAWARHCQGKRLQVNARKLEDILKEFVPAEEVMYITPAKRLCALAKSVGLVPYACGKPAIALTHDTDEAWLEFIDRYDIDLAESINFSKLLSHCREALRRSIAIADRVIDFDDQLYMPVIMRARFWQNDFIFLDEAQDINIIQRAMVKRALKPGGRLIAVGDRAQAIYGFRGADSSSMDNIKQEFNARELPLTVSYRCPKAVVEAAQAYRPSIQAAPNAPVGTVETLAEWNEKTVKLRDIIICRNTAPLVKMAYKLLRKRVPARVLGREIGSGLIALIDKMKVKTIDRLLLRLNQHLQRESAAALAKGEEQKADALADRVETIQVFIDQLEENRRTIPALKGMIESLFSDAVNGEEVRLMTGHKAKGLEADRVFILDWFRCPSKYARQKWQMEQEVNLQYVMITRSKRELYFVLEEMFGVVKPKEEAAPTAQEVKA